MKVFDPTRTEILLPIVGTTRWQAQPDGPPVQLGIWGEDFPCKLSVQEDNGTIRELTRAERRMIDRVNRKRARR